MIKKFLKIKNLGVFKDFEWDKNVIGSQGKPVVLEDINILFGGIILERLRFLGFFVHLK